MNTLSHVAIIMDGNGRWASKKNKPRKYGHLKGTENIKNLIPYFIKKKIPFLTLFAFGFDNWNRPKSEISYLFFLFENFLKKNLSYLIEKNVKIKFIGERKKLPSKILTLFKKVEKITKEKKDLTIIVALNYSSKHEIVNTFNKILNQKYKKITEKIISNNLYTFNTPDPDILIRTGSHSRLSNFLLWQISYTEIFFIKKLWPDFKIKDLSKIISKFKNIKRNFGSV